MLLALLSNQLHHFLLFTTFQSPSSISSTLLCVPTKCGTITDICFGTPVSTIELNSTHSMRFISSGSLECLHVCFRGELHGKIHQSWLMMIREHNTVHDRTWTWTDVRHVITWKVYITRVILVLKYIVQVQQGDQNMDQYHVS